MSSFTLRHPFRPAASPIFAERSSLGPTAAEEKVFGASLVVMGVHLIVVAILSRDRGDTAAAIATLAILPACVLLFRSHSRLVRTLLAGALGLGATAAGLAHHVARLVVAGPHASDFTGVLLALAGLALIGLAFRVALKGRGTVAKLLAIPVLVVLVQWFALPVLTAGIATNAARPHIASAATLGLPGARDVSFAAGDGTPLSGWYVPGRGDAAVILMHGSHGTRVDTLPELRMLAAAGYGVLAFDARGHGKSEGQTNALGWRGADDVAGAFDFLRRQTGVNPERIVALGLSMGGEEALRAAGSGIPLAAVVADGAGASTTGDMRLTSGADIPSSVAWLDMRAVELFSSESEPAPLGTLVRHITVPTLLIASGANGEFATDRAYSRRMGRHATLWYLPSAGHTQALAQHPDLYRARVTSFLADALAVR
jgi:uncharacterized protein